MIWIALLGMAAVTYLCRALPLLAWQGEPPPWLARWLAQVPPAVFAALAIPPLLVSNQSLNLDPERLAAGVVGAVVAISVRNVPLTIAAGLAAFWLVRVVG